ncbi:MAG: hypothetical protein H7641_12770, partial [Candidatus Heimdallarchaeota archaeon]|nr:hypothetical protein [Candidatus Heimdallarchaeota archaeon]MCK4878433.1 hypothetical protein [Candidatus Heimdallarchaeota archaeon]
PDWQHYYKEGGFFTSLFGLTYDIPYCNLNEWMLERGIEIMDFAERQQLYYDWQQLMMDKIIPIVPLFSNPNYEAIWSNTFGFDGRWGIADCLPYMSYEGFHEGQVSLEELNIETDWIELNPLYRPTWGLQFDYDNTRVLDLIHEPMIQWSPEQLPIKTGLINDWIKIDDNHLKFFLRDNIYWNPSYNITNRNAGSDPLDTITTGELMTGLKNSEYSDGSNQQVTAKDAVFTLLTFANPNVSYVPGYMEVFSDIYVDPLDPLAFHLHIDLYPETPKLEPYADFWMRLMERIMPEFFLNSTNPAVTYSLGGVKTVGLYDGIWNTPQWLAYSTSTFGCGKYMLDYFTNSITVFQRSPYWFGVGALDGTSGLTPFVQTINAHIISDSSVELAEFKAGNLDWMFLNQFPVDRRIMEEDSRFSIFKSLSPNFNYMAFNLRSPYIGGEWNYIFNPDETKEGYTLACSIRKAICYAIDKEEINEELYDGEKIIAHSLFYPYTQYYYYDDIIKYERDLEAAYDWLHVKDDLPDITVTVKNHDKVGKDLVVKARFDDSFDIISSTLKYRVNNGTWINETMTESSKNTYTFNLGQEFEKNDFVELFIESKTSEGNTVKSQTYSFSVGTLNPILEASFPTAVVAAFTLIWMVLVIRRITKKRR